MSGTAVVDGEHVVVPDNRWDLVPPPTAPPAVTAVVLHYRDPARLRLVLEGLALQSHPASRLQIVVADDGSDPLPAVPQHVTLVSQDDRGFRAAAARNLGAAAAEGDVICFLDGDTVPEPGYIAAASALPAVCTDVVVVGRRRHADLAGWGPDDVRRWFDGGRPPETFTEPEWLRDGYRASRDLLDADARSYRFVISAVLTVHRDLFAAVSGFDEGFAEYGGEDWDFAHRAFTAGAVLAHRRDAVAWHDGPDWGEREGGTPHGRTQKRHEEQELAERIPDHTERGVSFHRSAPEVLAEIVGGSTTDRSAAARSILAARDDVLVHLDAAAAGQVNDPRVVSGPIDRRIVQRIPYRLRAVAPVRLDDVGSLIDTAERASAGRVVTADGAVTLTAARALNRSVRHGIALDRLFPVITVGASARP